MRQHSGVKNVNLRLRVKIRTKYHFEAVEIESLNKSMWLPYHTMLLMEAKVHFQKTLKLDSYTRHHTVSTPGDYESVELEVDNFTNSLLPMATAIHATWLKDVHHSFRTFNQESPTWCRNTAFNKRFVHNYCHTIKVSNHKTYFFFRKHYEPINYLAVFNSLLKKWDGTWNEASELCESVGGHLPVFNSRDDMEEVLTIFKTIHYMPAVPAIYIGLTSDESRNVSCQK